MSNPVDIVFREDIAKRIADMKARNRQKRGNGLEDMAREIFNPDNIVDVQVKVPLVKQGRPYFNLNEKFIQKCIREGKMMRISWPDGSALHDPKDWLKGEPYQKEFRFEGQPMHMRGHYLDLEE